MVLKWSQPIPIQIVCFNRYFRIIFKNVLPWKSYGLNCVFPGHEAVKMNFIRDIDSVFILFPYTANEGNPPKGPHNYHIAFHFNHLHHKMVQFYMDFFHL